MAHKDSTTEELEQKLSFLSQSFNREMAKMADRRLQLDKQSPGEDLARVDCAKWMAKLAKRPLGVRLEPSLGQRLAESRGKAHELEDGLQETRAAFEDRLESVDRMRTDLRGKEDLVVRSVRQIEGCLRSVFCMKREADATLAQLEHRFRELEGALEELRSSRCSTLLRKRYLLDVADAFRPARGFLERAVLDHPPCDLVAYFLVLVSLRDDLLAQGEECALAREELSGLGRRLEGRRARAPTLAVSRENEILELKSRLGALRNETARLEEQIDLSISSRQREDSAWYDVQRWIKKLYSSTVEIRIADPGQPRPDGATDMLEALKDFVTDAVQMVDRLKTDKLQANG